MVAIPSLPSLPPFQLSTGPQVTDGRFQNTANTTFGGDFFGRGGSGFKLDNTALLIGLAVAAGAGFLIVTGRLKI